jgi:hypothetical protein
MVTPFLHELSVPDTVISISIKKMECLWVYDIERHFQQYFCYIMSVSFSGGSNPEKTTVLPKLTDKL